MSERDVSTATADALDASIDQVAARLVAVPDDADMVLRIVSALPERSSRLAWLLPQFAALSAFALAAVLWSMREQPAPPAVLPATVIAGFSAPPLVSARQPALRTVRTQPSESSEPLEPLRADFDRSLPALELSAIGPAPLAIADGLTLAPLEIGELPLTADAISPNKFE